MRAARYLVGLAIFAGLALGVAELQAEITRFTGSGGGSVTAGTGISVSSGTVSLQDTAVTPGSYTYAGITVDQQGRLTAASSGSQANFPSAGEKSALAGTSGTPGSGNKYVTDADSRNSDSRAPSGSASGELTGTYPSPTLASSIAGGKTLLTDDATNNSSTTLLTLTHTTSGTAAAGIGSKVLYRTEDGSGNVQDTADITGALSVVTNNSELGYLRLRAMDGAGGSAALGDAIYAWGNGRLGIGTSTTAPRGPLDIISATTPVVTLDITGSAGSYGATQVRRSGTVIGTWGINSSDEFTLTQGGSTLRVGTNTGITANTRLGINQSTLPAAMIEVTPSASTDLLKLGAVCTVTSGGTVTISGDLKAAGVIWNTAAGNESSTASAGGVATLPLTARGYLIIKDSGGNSRKVPYYDP